ncbi:TPA: hypothetical protein EYP70_04460 [Candidatus Bathyarchaeota archaeon]|nr:hypothetical protein [Candidatus Bathyarchaeota archaeon]
MAHMASPIFLFIYILTILLASTEMVALPVAALIGASLTVFFGIHYGLFTYEEAVSFIDIKLLTLLVGMMIISEIAERSGLFRIVALYAIKLAGGDPVKLFFSICYASAAVSLLLSDITAIMLIAAAVGTISKIMNYNPTPYFISAAIMINLGGTSTLIGSVSNMIIGASSGLSFSDFIGYMALCELALWFITSIALYLYYKDQLGEKKELLIYDPWEGISDKTAAYKALFIISLLFLLLFFSDRWEIGPEAVALGCAVLALALGGVDPSKVFRRLDWETIFIIGGFFIIIGGVEKTGLLTQLSQYIFQVSGKDVTLAALFILWSSGLISAVMSNITVALTFAPIIKGLPGLNTPATWTALVFGTNLGGAATPFSGAVCILCLGALKREGVTLSFAEFTKIGVLTTLMQLSFSAGYLVLRFGLWG